MTWKKTTGIASGGKKLRRGKEKTPFDIIKCGLPTALKNQKENIQVNGTSSLAHTRWNCKYHIVFAPTENECIEFCEVPQGEKWPNNTRVTWESKI